MILSQGGGHAYLKLCIRIIIQKLYVGPSMDNCIKTDLNDEWKDTIFFLNKN